MKVLTIALALNRLLDSRMCEERLKLLDTYGEAVEAFAFSTSNLKLALASPFEDFQLKMEECSVKLSHLHDAQFALRKHRQEHGC